jgi:hypothetical protein
MMMRYGSEKKEPAANLYPTREILFLDVFRCTLMRRRLVFEAKNAVFI